MAHLYLAAASLNVWALILMLAGGIAEQLIIGELPCPLCVMQRVALMLCALGPLHILLSSRSDGLTVRAAAVGNGMAIVAALLGAAVAGRQMLLHIAPGDPGFGSPVLGIHLYTWALIAFVCQIAASGVLLLAVAWLEEKAAKWPSTARFTAIAFVAIVTVNLLAVVAEAGLNWGLPENPVDYLLFK